MERKPASEPPRHRAVRWLSPTELGRTSVTVALGSVAAAYADKRDVMSGSTFAQPHATFSAAPGEDFWLDFVSDTGDGFPAMCTVATLLGQPVLHVDGEELPRGRVLLLGGDEVYPVGEVRAYEERLEGPLTAQFVGVAGDEQPTVFAIPGNHDWYDGVTAFLRVFGQGRDLAGWRTAQLDWFRGVVDAMAPGDRIILCTAMPAWYGAQDGDERAMDRLAFFLRDVLGGRDHPVRLVLTGDTHHYARYTLRPPGVGQDGARDAAVGEDQVLVTAGHGGAYTSATHFLDRELRVTGDLADPAPERATGTHRYELGPHTFPTPRVSRAEARRVLWRLPTRNGPVLLLLLAALQALVVVPALLDAPVLVGLGAVVVGGVSFAVVAPQRRGRWRRVGFGLLLAVPELIVAAVGAIVARAVVDRAVVAQAVLPRAGVAGAVDHALATAAVVLVAGLLASLVLASFFLAFGRWTNRNELFAAQSIENHKGFLRLRVAPDGALTVFALGVERVPRRWRWRPGETPRYRTEDAWAVHLVDEPFVLRP